MTAVQGQGTANDEIDLGNLYLGALANFLAFPPLGPSDIWASGETKAVEATFASLFLSVDDISPADSEFTVTLRNTLMWETSSCNLTEPHARACDQIENTLHFLIPQNVKGRNVYQELHQGELFVEDLTSQGLEALIPSVDLVDEQLTVNQKFDTKTYPFEFHRLRVQFLSTYSNNVVNISAFNVNAGSLQPDVPPGWTFHGANCMMELTNGQRAVAGDQPILFSTYTCEIVVARTNTGWWLTSFLIFIGINLVCYIQGLGRTSHLIAECRDDKDAVRGAIFEGLRLNGIYSFGLLLTYVFQVQQSPYDQPIEFWPSVSASTKIFMLGLFGILCNSVISIFMAMQMKKALIVDGFVGGATKVYDMKTVPKEPECPESAGPLLDRPDSAPSIHGPRLPMGEKTTARKPKEEGPSEKVESEAFDVEPVQASRKKNMKSYNVLSVQEARWVNYFVLLEFWTMLMVFVGVCLSAAIILLKARNEYRDRIE